MSLSAIEISSLRSEIVNYSGQVLDLVKFAVTASCALIGFGLSRGDHTAGYILLVPLLILAPSQSLVMNRRQGIVRIAAYLRAFAGEEFKYESRLWQIRQRHDIPWVSYQFSIFQVFVTTGFVCIALSFFFLIEKGLLMIIPFLAGLLWLLFSIAHWRKSRRIKSGGDLDGILFDAWLQTLDEGVESNKHTQS